MTEMNEQTLSDWIPASTPPVIEGIYEVKDARVFGGYQRFKEHWRGVIES